MPNTSVPKRFTSSVQNSYDPAKTLKFCSTHFGAMGITRVADITGLDTIGIPVCVAIRPNAKSLSVSQGKGLTLINAKVSAVMESIETYHAENVKLPIIIGKYRHLAADTTICDPATLSLHPLSPYHEDLPLRWVTGFDLIRQVETLVPYDLVHCCFLAGMDRIPVFSMSSNGLASGNHILEAISRAICEVVERDALYLWELQYDTPRHSRSLLDLNTISSPSCRKLLGKLKAAGLLVFIWEQTSDTGFPCFGCMIAEEQASRLNLTLGPYAGFGCDLNTEVALIRAITEAAQSRLTHIAGSRDDMFRKSYTRLNVNLDSGGLLEYIRHLHPVRDFRSLPSLATGNLESDVATQLTRLVNAGFDQVIAVELTDSSLSIPVVRIIIPGMEFSLHHEGVQRRPNQRTFKRLLQLTLNDITGGLD